MYKFENILKKGRWFWAIIACNNLLEKALHKNSLTRCIAEELIPKGLKLELESTIGYFDQKFVDEWFSKLKGFSLKLMKEITTYSEKSIKSTNESMWSTEAILRNLTENQEFLNIEKILKIDVEATKRQKDQTPRPLIQQFNIWENQVNQTSKKNHQLSWKMSRWHPPQEVILNQTLKVLDFVQETMQTLSNWIEQLQTHLEINLTHQEILWIYQNTRFLLIHISASKENLNFIPTSKSIVFWFTKIILANQT